MTKKATAWSGVSQDGKVIATISVQPDRVRIDGSIYCDPFIYSADTWQAVALKAIKALVDDRPHLLLEIEAAIVNAIISMRIDKHGDCPLSDQTWHYREPCGLCDIGTRSSIRNFIYDHPESEAK